VRRRPPRRSWPSGVESRARDDESKPVLGHDDHLVAAVGSRVAAGFPDLAVEPHLSVRPARGDHAALPADQRLGADRDPPTTDALVPEDDLTGEEREADAEPDVPPGGRKRDEQDEREEENMRRVYAVVASAPPASPGAACDSSSGRARSRS
jgi:hypothetical protein